MADQVDNPASGTKSQDTDNIFDGDIGDDWGEAFASEDDMFSSEDEASSSFFLDEKETTTPSPAAEKKVTTEPPAKQKNKTKQKKSNSNLLHYVFLCKAKLFSLSRPVQIAIGTGLVVIFIGIFFINSRSADKIAEPQPPQLSTGKPAEKPPTPIVETTPPAQIESHQIGNIKNHAATIPPEKVSKKWHLPLFFVSIAGENGKRSTILTINLTLLLILHKDELPPDNQQVITRDAIFQFFNAKPLSEIKRYSLARGDMNRQLRSWINKQVPDLPLEAITFNRYQIL